MPSTTEGITTRYGSTITSADLNFGIFISRVKTQRSDTHDSDTLLTRNEGLIWSLQASLPMLSRLRAQYSILDEKQVERTVVEIGTLEGFKVTLSLRAFLGT